LKAKQEEQQVVGIDFALAAKKAIGKRAGNNYRIYS
jgi:hypothetical protein